jgi:cysteine desulfurase
MRIYLDHNATTPVRDEVAEAMVRVLRQVPGNPSSTHAEGAAARRCVEDARDSVAALLGVAPRQVIFTAGATEANNAVLAGAVGRVGRTLITTQVEHPSVLEPAASLEKQGHRVVRLPVDAGGVVDPDAVDDALRAAGGPALVSVIWANNETGVLQPVEAIAERARARGAWVHVDATQALGKVPVDLGRIPVDWLSCSAHKLGGPKGTGALVMRSGIELAPLLAGGPQERRLRGGTENTAGIVGFGAACELARAELALRGVRYAALRDRLWQGLRAAVPRVRRNGDPDRVLPNTLNVEIEGAAGEVLLQALDVEGVAASAGAACHSGSISPSHVLTAMGLDPEQARASLRLSVGHGVDEAQVDRAVALLGELVPRVRAMEPA